MLMLDFLFSRDGASLPTAAYPRHDVPPSFNVSKLSMRSAGEILEISHCTNLCFLSTKENNIPLLLLREEF